MTILSPRLLKMASFGAMGALLLLYGYFQLRDVFYGPRLTMSGLSTSDTGAETITLTGVSTDIASLTVNGRRIFTDTDGNFSEKIILLDGYNVLEVRATDKLARTRTERIEVVRRELPRETVAVGGER